MMKVAVGVILTTSYLDAWLDSLSGKMVSYRQRLEDEKKKEEWKGHNHPFNEKCGPHCPRNEHYKGPVKKPSLFGSGRNK